MNQKKRKRNILIAIGVIVLLLVIWVMSDKDLMQLVIGPKLPGYSKHAPSGQYADIDWKNLQQGCWEYGKKPIVKPDIAQMSDKYVHVKGFMLPFHEAGPSSQFFIAGRPRGCYFCNPPGVAEIVQVNVANGKQLDLTDWPVSIYGTLKVATGKPDDKMLYIIDNAVVVAER
ncbi:MAG: DUF3299 domain-containing protein [bacterium]